MVSKFFRFIALLFAAGVASVATPALAEVSATFNTGAIAEYTGPNANQNSNVKSFSTLGISKIVMSQSGSTWGGTQGNDTAVTITIHFNDATTYQFSGVLNWQLNDGGSAIPVSYFGVTTANVVPDADDRYTRSSTTTKKTYILVLPSKVVSSNFASLVTTDGTDGSANFNEAAIFAALNAEFAPANLAPSFNSTNATGANNAPSYSFDYAENRASGATVGTVSATDPEGGALTFSITGGNTDGWYAINPTTGAITLTAAGAASLANDFEQTPNTQTLTVTVSDGTNSTSIEVKLNETNLDDAAPLITGPSGGEGAAASAISVNENQTGVTKVTANEPVTWSISGGSEAGKFAIAADGTITFVAAPDYERPSDGDTNNTYVLTITATDADGNASVQTITVTVLNLDDTAPLITGPSGGEGAAASAISVNENQTGVTKVTANEPVTWSISGGSEAGKFQIAADGTITFVAAPDYERPTDGDTNNTYVLTVTATDADGNASQQTITVTVLDLDDTAPAITGPSGGPAAATSAISVNENQTGVTKLTAGENVTWSITGGNEAGKFQIAPDGTITFVAAPDYERPTDGDTNNTYVLTVTATDAAGNASQQTITVTVLDLDDTAPAITGPSGGPAAATSAISVNENQTGVTKLTAGENVTWSITGGNEAGKFQIAPDGTITFVAAPDYERPTDGDTNNTYVLTVTATDAAGNTSVQTITVTVLNLDDTAPLITGPSGGEGAAASAISVNENQTGVTKVTANEPVTWSITGGSEAGKFAIAADGTITFVAAPDYERPSDGDTNNTYVLTVTATDAAGNASVQTITVTVLDLDDTAPLITGPSGGAGAAASAISVNENQTGVTKVTANEPVTWSISGGSEAGKFAIAADGTITFVAAPDYERPTDGDTNNTYVLTITATDAAGNASVQTITVTVLDLDDTAPLITGPSGGAGAAASAITINEGLTAVTSFTANEAVTWSIDGGSDAGSFRIDPATGALVFVAAPDFETPTDSDRNNTYVVRIKAVDAAGNVSYQTLTVTIINVDEIGRKLAQIGDKLRTSLRGYAVQGLSDMLSFNESLMRAGNDDGCTDPKARKGLSGSANANQSGGQVKLGLSQQLSECGRPSQVFADLGLSYSKMGGNWTSRMFASLRYERRLDEDLTLGLGLLASRGSDELQGFASSAISDESLQLNLYSRYQLSERLRTGAFVGFGRAWYDFGLAESDGFVLDGSMTGKRQMYGWMLSGDFNLGDTVITTDAIISHAKETLGSATLAARYLGENRSGIAFAVGSVDTTRISVPVTAPIQLSGNTELGSSARLLLSPGLLCEDNDVELSSLRCGYQLGAKLVANDGGRNRFYADYRWESVAGMRRSLIGLGYAYRFGDKGLELALEANRGLTGITGQDNRAMIAIRLAQ